MTIQINHKENNKLRVRNADASFTKHEVVKLLIMILSRQRYKTSGIYSEYELINGDIVDVMIDLDGHDKVYYEIQKDISKDWMQDIKERDLDLDINTLIIPIKDLSDNLSILTEELKRMIV